MSQNIYDLLNNIETDFADYPQDTPISESAIHKLKKNIHTKIKSRHYLRPVAAAACLCLVLGAVCAGPLKVQVNAAAKLLSYKISHALGIHKDLTPYENVVNQSVTDQNITVTLNEVILDKDSITISTTESADAGSPTGLTGLVYINGQLIMQGASGSSAPLGEGLTGTVMEYDIKGIDTSGKLDVELELFDEGNGRWDFAFQADGSELKTATAEQSLDIPISLPDQSQISLRSLSVNPAATKIYYDYIVKIDDHDLMLKGTDSLGNPIAFYRARSDSSGGQLRLDTLTGEIGENAESLTLTPYAVKFPEHSGRMSNDWQQTGDTFTIPLP